MSVSRWRPPSAGPVDGRGTGTVAPCETVASMSEEDLERYESEIELALVQEYRAVLPLFTYVMETERRFYLANNVEVTVRSDSTPACVEVDLRTPGCGTCTGRPASCPRCGS